MEKPYVKEFDKWNNLAKPLNDAKSPEFFHEREIWWCALGVNIGSEQDGKNENFERPVLIIRKINQDLLFVVPITSKLGNYSFRITTYILEQESQILIAQARAISSKRLLRKIGQIKNMVFYKVSVELIKLIIPQESETPLLGGESRRPVWPLYK